MPRNKKVKFTESDKIWMEQNTDYALSKETGKYIIYHCDSEKIVGSYYPKREELIFAGNSEGNPLYDLVKQKLDNAPAKKLSYYEQLIVDATNCPVADIAEIEDYMRHTIFHSTLSWQTKQQLNVAAKQAWKDIQWMRSPEGIAYMNEATAEFYKKEDGGSIDYFKENLETVKGKGEFGETLYAIRDKNTKEVYVQGGGFYTVHNLKQRGFSHREAQDILQEAVVDADFKFPEWMKDGGSVSEKKDYWYAVHSKGMKPWDEHEQHKIENATWAQAVKEVKAIANEKKTEVRLSNSKGYNNQGYYFHFMDRMEKGGSIWLSVDKGEPVTFDEFVKINTAPDVHAPTQDEFENVKFLKVGETATIGNVKIERVAETDKQVDSLSLKFKDETNFNKAKKHFAEKSDFTPFDVNDEFRSFEFQVQGQDDADSLEHYIMQELEGDTDLQGFYFEGNSSDTEFESGGSVEDSEYKIPKYENKLFESGKVIDHASIKFKTAEKIQDIISKNKGGNENSDYENKILENGLVIDHAKISRETAEQIQELISKTKSVDLFFGHLGNGISVSDKNREENRDYKNVAHISEEGEIEYYDKNLPDYAIKQIEAADKPNKMRVDYSHAKPDHINVSAIQQALNGNDFWLHPESEDAKIIDEAVKWGYVRRPSHTQAYWTDKGSKLFEKGGSVNNTAEILIISSKNPLSKQLSKITGDSWNMQDFEELTAKKSEPQLIKHKKSGAQFVVFADTYFGSVDKHVINDDLSYLMQYHGITNFTKDGKPYIVNRPWIKKEQGGNVDSKDLRIEEVPYHISNQKKYAVYVNGILSGAIIESPLEQNPKYRFFAMPEGFSNKHFDKISKAQNYIYSKRKNLHGISSLKTLMGYEQGGSIKSNMLETLKNLVWAFSNAKDLSFVQKKGIEYARAGIENPASDRVKEDIENLLWNFEGKQNWNDVQKSALKQARELIDSFVVNLDLRTNPAGKNRNAAARWIMDVGKDSAKYKVAALLLAGTKNPDEVLGIGEDRYANILRSIASVTESEHEMAFRTNNYSIAEAEKWAKESAEKNFVLNNKMEQGGSISFKKPNIKMSDALFQELATASVTLINKLGKEKVQEQYNENPHKTMWSIYGEVSFQKNNNDSHPSLKVPGRRVIDYNPSFRDETDTLYDTHIESAMKSILAQIFNSKMEQGGTVSPSVAAFEEKIKDLLNQHTQPNKLQHIIEYVDGKEVQLSLYVESKTAEVVRFTINGNNVSAPRFYQTKEDVLKMIMANFGIALKQGGAVELTPNQQIAATILHQLGGQKRLKLFTGAYDIYAIDNGVRFKIKNVDRGAPNYVKIVLTPMDLYDMEIGRIGTKTDMKYGTKEDTYKIVHKYQGVYDDMLMDLFEKGTGMFLHFEKGGEINNEKTKLVVIDEHTLGYIEPGSDYAGVLHASVLRGSHLQTPVLIKSNGVKYHKVRLASKKDFDDFRVSFDGYNNEDVYEFDKSETFAKGGLLDLTPLQKEVVAEYKKSANPNSKHYSQDLADFIRGIKTKTEGELKRNLANMKWLNSKQSEQYVNHEVGKLDRAGMFNINRMKPKNALD